MGVKKKFRPDWLAAENTLFINKLNYVVKHFDEDHKSVSAFHRRVLNVKADFDFLFQVKNLKNTVYNIHKVSLSENELNLRDVTEDLRFTKVKL